MLAIGAQTFPSLESMQRKLGALSNAARDQGRLRGAQRAADLIADQARRNVPRSTNDRPGHVHLADTIGTRLYQHDATVTRIGVGTDDPRGEMLEKGTAPHEIVARNAGALYWPGARHPVKRVRHPGTRARPWLVPAYEDARDAAGAAFGAAVVEAAHAEGGS
jgi:Bacteriophage HK97-gp10, putative tail-component